MFENPVFLAQREKASNGGGAFLVRMVRRSEPDEYQAVRVGIGQGAKQHRLAVKPGFLRSNRTA